MGGGAQILPMPAGGAPGAMGAAAWYALQGTPPHHKAASIPAIAPPHAVPPPYAALGAQAYAAMGAASMGAPPYPATAMTPPPYVAAAPPFMGAAPYAAAASYSP